MKIIKLFVCQVLILLVLCACYSQTNTSQLLAQSVINGDVSKVITYLDKGADPNYIDSGVPIIFNSIAGKSLKCNNEILSALLQRSANPNIEGLGFYPILIAVSTGDIKCIDLLLKYGAEINIQNSVSGSTVLHEAIVLNDTDLIEYLLKKGAKKGVEDFKGVTALQAAKRTGRHSIVGLLE